MITGDAQKARFAADVGHTPLQPAKDTFQKILCARKNVQNVFNSNMFKLENFEKFLLDNDCLVINKKPIKEIKKGDRLKIFIFGPKTISVHKPTGGYIAISEEEANFFMKGAKKKEF